MHIHNIKKLRHGDEVYFKDPDNDECSDHYIIRTIKHLGHGLVIIVDVHGRVLECYARELK